MKQKPRNAQEKYTNGINNSPMKKRWINGARVHSQLPVLASDLWFGVKSSLTCAQQQVRGARCIPLKCHCISTEPNSAPNQNCRRQYFTQEHTLDSGVVVNMLLQQIQIPLSAIVACCDCQLQQRGRQQLTETVAVQNLNMYAHEMNN